MNKAYSRLSKSQYLRGFQCPKALWLYRHRPDLAPDISPHQQQIFDSGHEVGILAQKYFDDGVEITDEYFEIDKAITSTKNHIQNGLETIFEATACSQDGAYSRIDILKKADDVDAWDLIEAKQSTSVKDYQLHDIAFQRYAFEGAGYNIRNSYLMHLNSDYVRFCDLNLQELFILEDCTGIIAEQGGAVADTLKSLLTIINSTEEPINYIGPHCSNPFECNYSHYCWQHIPEYSVYNIFKGNKLNTLLEQRIFDISGVPENFDCTPRQFIDINAFKHQCVHADKLAIQNFLNGLNFPLFYLDYETIFPPIPLFDNSSPYQQIPFQFSLHIQERPGDDVEHIEFLHTESSDPRPEFVKALVESCRGTGSVIVYNKGFESRINNELAAAFSGNRDDLQDINDRMIDLLVPFRSRALYHPAMMGSASLKSVLPAFAPDLNYDNMEIGDGGTASMMYLLCLKELFTGEEKEQVYRNLRDYCCLDTMAEVRLLDVLRQYAI